MQVTGLSNVIAIAAGGYLHTLALAADRTVWTWGDETQLGRDGDYTVPGPVTNLTNVVAITGGEEFDVVVTGDGHVYSWGNNGYGQLGTNNTSVSPTGIGYTNMPMLVPGISNAVAVSAHPSNYHALALTVDHGTNRYWGWGYNQYGEVGNGTSGNNVYTPTALQFSNICPPCANCVQLGTNGSFTAHCTGTLVLYFNDEQYYPDNAGSFTAITIVPLITTNVTVWATNGNGVAVGTVTNGDTYTFTATGMCSCNPGDFNCTGWDANGGDPQTCSYYDMSAAVCPLAKCFSLVGKIQ